MRIQPIVIAGLFFWAAFACTPKPEASPQAKMEKLPYFDLAGFIEQEIPKVDGAKVSKISRVQNQEETAEVVYSVQDWKEELDIFFQADINKPSLAQSYDTQLNSSYLIHTLLPGEKGKVKEITIRYDKDKPSGITVKLEEENMFYSSTTIGQVYFNIETQTLDHYSVESTQKIWLLKPNNMKIMGAVK
jgi:hypothetical protein